MAIILIIMFVRGIGTQRRGPIVILLLNVVIAFACCFFEIHLKGNGSLFSHLSTESVIKESFETFKIVHPVENAVVAFSHFLTYWIHAAQWFAKAPRNVMIYAFLTEVFVAFVNESTHNYEWQTELRCSRTAFIQAIESSVYDSMWREFVLGPFFVYFYLLPKFVSFWLLGITIY
jgi:hypothetical protein